MKSFSIFCGSIYDREPAHFWHGRPNEVMANLRERNFVVSKRRFVKSDSPRVLINNNLCDKKSRSVVYILFLMVALKAR